MNQSQNRYVPYVLGACVLVCLVAVLFFRPGARQGGGAPEAPEAVAVAEAPEAPAAPRVSTAPRPASTPAPRAVVDYRLSGTVTALDAGPIEGATVALFVDDPGTFAEPRLTVQTGPDGTYEIVLLERDLPAGFIALAASAEGHVSRIERVHRAGERNFPIRQDFELPLGASIAGRVVDTEGRPVAQARIGRFQQVGFSGLRSDDPNETFPSILSQADGSFVLAGLAQSEEHLLIARKEGYIPTLSEPTVAGGGEIEIVLREGEAGVEGYVFDPEGNPVANVPVKSIYMRGGAQPAWGSLNQPPPNLNEQFTFTDEQGYYRIGAVRAGWQGVVAGHGRPVGRSIAEAVLLEPGDYKTVNLKFRPPLEITGVVVERGTGNPISGARLAGISPEDASRHPSLVRQSESGEAVSDQSGAFSLKVDFTAETALFQSAALYYLPPVPFANPTDNWRTVPFRLNNLESGEPIRIEVDALYPLRGIVVTADGEKPVPGAEVRFIGGVRRGGWGGGGAPRSFGGGTTEATTDLNGRFELALAPGSTGRVDARFENLSGSTPATVNEVGESAELKIVIQPTSSIAGHIMDPDGAPIAGVTVSATVDRGRDARFQRSESTSAVSDESGAYLLENVVPGQIRVSVERPDGYLRVEPRTVALNPGEPLTEIDFTLVPGGANLEGIVVDEENAPISGATVSLSTGGRRGGNWGRWGGGGASAVETGEDGRFSLEITDPRLDVFTIAASHPSYEDTQREGILLADSPVTLQMIRRPRIRITVTDADGGSVGDYDYLVTMDRQQASNDRRNLAQRRVVAQTSAVEETLSTGQYYVHVHALDSSGERDGRYGFTMADLTVENSPLDVNVQLGEALRIEGQVVDMDDNAIPDAEVELLNIDMPRGNRENNTRTNSEGRFTFANVASGTVRLTAEVEDLVLVDPVQMSLVAGEQPGFVTLRMSSGSTVLGTVIDVDGEPFTGASVSVGGGRASSANVDEAGAYRVTDLSPGSYSVVLRTPTGSYVMEKPLQLGAAAEETVDFDLTDLVHVFGAVYRNGRIQDERNTRIVLKPQGGGDSVEVRLGRTGRYESYLKPDTYEIHVVSSGGNVTAHTGMDATIGPSPKRQEMDLRLLLEQVDAVIVVPDGGQLGDGTLTYTHINSQGVQSVSSFGWNQTIFAIPNQPLGRCRAEFRSSNGVRYVSDWVEIQPGAEKILTLIPEDVAGG